MSSALMKRLNTEIDQRSEDLVETTRAPIQIPTLNPPGDHYRDICEYLEARLAQAAFHRHSSGPRISWRFRKVSTLEHSLPP